MFHLLICASSGLSVWVRVPGEMSLEMAHTHPMAISIQGFNASHLLQLSTNQYFRINGKQTLLAKTLVEIIIIIAVTNNIKVTGLLAICSHTEIMHVIEHFLGNEPVLV